MKKGCSCRKKAEEKNNEGQRIFKGETRKECIKEE